MSEMNAQGNRELVVLLTRGTDHELSSVAFTIACGGITSGIRSVRLRIEQTQLVSTDDGFRSQCIEPKGA